MDTDTKITLISIIIAIVGTFIIAHEPIFDAIEAVFSRFRKKPQWQIESEERSQKLLHHAELLAGCLDKYLSACTICLDKYQQLYDSIKYFCDKVSEEVKNGY